MSQTTPTDDGQTVTNPPDGTPIAPQQTAPATASPVTPQATPAPTSQPTQSNPAPGVSVPATAPKTPQPSPNGATVSNPAPHPAVQKASLLRDVAQALAGGPRYQTSIDPQTGMTTRTEIPLSGRQIGMAIALEAISGSLSGLAQRGPNAAAQAGVAGLKQGAQQFQQRQQAEQQQEAQAQNDLARHYQVLETNLRILQNAQSVGRTDYDSNNAYVAQFKPLADMLQAQHPEVVKGIIDESDIPKYHFTKDSAIPYAVSKRLDPQTGQQVVDHNGVPQWDIQYMIIDPNFKADNFLSDDDRDFAHKFRLPGFADGDGNPTKLPQSLPMRLSMALSYKAKIASLRLAEQDVNGFYSTLNGSGDGKQAYPKVSLTDAIQKDPTLPDALEKFQPLLNASQQNYEKAIGELGAKDPQAAGKVLQMYGGTSAVMRYDAMRTAQLEANKKLADYGIVDTLDKAQGILANPRQFTPDQVNSARNFLAISDAEGARKASQDARARAVAEGTDYEMMLKTGVNPISGEKLTLANAPDSMLVDPNGNVVPQNQQTLYKPTAMQKQTADTARQALAISADLQAQIAKNPGLIGPLSGNSAKAFAPFGIGTEAAQKMLDNVSLLQSAVTKMHTGRFSSEILKKSGNLIFPGMNVDQFNGAMDSLKDVAGRYANEDQLTTVANYRQQQSTGAPNLTQPRTQAPPAGATMKVPGSDGKLHWSDGKRDLGVVQ